MPSTVEKYRTLVERLYAKTADRTISWEGSDDADMVYASVAGKTIILRFKDDEDTPLVIVSIYEGERRIESFTDEDVGGEEPAHPEFSSYWPLMKQLWEMAQRQATGADDVLDSLLEELSDRRSR